MFSFRIWESYGVEVVVNTSDITTRAGCEKLIRDSMKLGPVGGIFNLAVQLRDNIFENQEIEKFKECMAPKADATMYLDELTRKLCPELQYFVVFSSVSCGRGNAGQSNYGMANSVMERIMEQRHQDGLPAKAIQWGAVGEVGLVADMAEDKIDIEIGGTLQQRISSCLEELDSLLDENEPLVSSMVVAEKRKSSGSKNIMDDIMMIMGIKDHKSISNETKLSELGMDSLMTVEIQQTLEREYDLSITAQNLRSLTIAKLLELTSRKSSPSQEDEALYFGLEMSLRNLGEERNAERLYLPIFKSNKKDVINLIIPGVEGLAGEIWSNLSDYLSGQTVVLQHKNLEQMESIQEIVSKIKEQVLSIFDKFESFTIIAYSFGTLIALKLAEFLESKGILNGKILFIDGSHKFAKKVVISRFGLTPNDIDIENGILNSTTYFVIKEKDQHISNVIQSDISCEQKIDKIIAISNDLQAYSNDFVKTVVIEIINKTKLITVMNPNNFVKLDKFHIQLVRPKLSSIRDIEEDYYLSEVCSKPIDVKFIEGDHITMLDSPEMLEILRNLNN
jgi:fatty acid synthase, animal type